MMVGPPLSKGPLPALIYFALSAEESLHLDPFNQPVKALENENMRIFSFTLPHHEDKKRDLSKWDETIIHNFVHSVKEKLPDLNAKTLGVMGLSRGGMLACRLAAICPEITHILGFAPMTTFLEGIESHIWNRTLRFYIGNMDTRVGTDMCFNFFHKIALKAKEKRVQSPPLELLISPSIGFKGHGTPKHIFTDGAHWIKEGLHV